MGLPVVTTDAGGVSEAVADGLTGRVVPLEALASTLAELAADPSLCARMGAAGTRWAADTHAPAVMVQKHVDLYERLLRR